MAVRVVASPPSRGEVYLIELDPTRGGEIRKTRPCLVVSPDETNHHLRTVIVAPMTTAGHLSPFRVTCRFAGKQGRVVLDQLRTVDGERLKKRLGVIRAATMATVLAVLGEMFEP